MLAPLPALQTAFSGSAQIRSRVAWRRIAACQRRALTTENRWGQEVRVTNRILARPRRLPLCLLLAAGVAQAAAADGDGLGLAPEPPAPDASPSWEGAIGLIVAYRPAFSGAGSATTSLTPGLFLRRGRLSITNASGFVTRRAEDVGRGIGLDLLQGSRWKARMGLRWDNGRRESGSEELRGLGDIPATARVRFSLGLSLGASTNLGLNLNSDLFGRGGGSIADVSLGHAWRLTGSTTVSASLGLSVAGDRYLQTWYGITPEQSLRSGRPVYEPGAGWRDASAGLGFRTDLSRDWVLTGGVGISHLLGPAAQSPLVTSRTGWGFNGGLAWRF